MRFQTAVRIVNNNYDFHENIYSITLISKLNDFFLRNTNFTGIDYDVYCTSLEIVKEMQVQECIFPHLPKSEPAHAQSGLTLIGEPGTHCTP